MKILAIETSTSSCSVAVINNRCLLAEYICSNKKTHSSNLMTMTEKLLKQLTLKISSINGFAVALGPGSFTGLRIGISFVKGMSCGTGKPVVGVNSLDALAYPLKNVTIHPVVPIIDAKKNKIYYSICCNGKKIAKKKYGFGDINEIINNIPMDSIVIGDGVTKYNSILKKKSAVYTIKENDTYNIIRASSVGFIARMKLVNTDVKKFNNLIPQYMHKFNT